MYDVTIVVVEIQTNMSGLGWDPRVYWVVLAG